VQGGVPIAIPQYLGIIEQVFRPRESAEATRSYAVESSQGMLAPLSVSDGAIPRALPKVLGDYEILERLGGGGMGEVYKARHLRLQRIVVVKTLKPGWHWNPSSCGGSLGRWRLVVDWITRTWFA